MWAFLFITVFQADPSKPVLAAGDPEKVHMQQVINDGGLRYHKNQIKSCHSLAKRLNISPIKFN